VTLDKMTNILFPGAVRMGVKVSRDVLVQKVRGVENVIEVKAAHRGFQPTNLMEAAFEPFFVASGKRLVVELWGQDGRKLELKIRGRLLWTRRGR